MRPFFLVHRGFPGKPDESSKHSSEFGSSIGSCKAGNIKTFAGARPASEQPQAPRLACKQPPTAPPLQRGTISNFCSLCGRLLAGDLSRANAAQQPRKKRSFRLSRKSPMSHQNIQMHSAAALVPARLATSRLLPERALQANSRKPQDSLASSLPQAPLQRRTISNFCSPCGRLLAGDLSRANAAQQPRKKRSFRLFPEIRDEPFFCLPAPYINICPDLPGFRAPQTNHIAPQKDTSGH